MKPKVQGKQIKTLGFSNGWTPSLPMKAFFRSFRTKSCLHSLPPDTCGVSMNQWGVCCRSLLVKRKKVSRQGLEAPCAVKNPWWGFGWVDKAPQCFRSAWQFGAAGSSPDFSRVFHGMALLCLCQETLFPCTILSYPGQPPPLIYWLNWTQTHIRPVFRFLVFGKQTYTREAAAIVNNCRCFSSVCLQTSIVYHKLSRQPNVDLHVVKPGLFFLPAYILQWWPDS